MKKAKSHPIKRPRGWGRSRVFTDQMYVQRLINEQVDKKYFQKAMDNAVKTEQVDRAILKRVTEEYAKLGELRGQVEQLTSQATLALQMVGQQAPDKNHMHMELEKRLQSLADKEDEILNALRKHMKKHRRGLPY